MVSMILQADSPNFRTYSRGEVVVVFRTKESFGGLSNMASGFALHVNGTRILTSEALYQACRFPHLPEVQREIIGQHSPMTAKMKSKPYRHHTRPDWDYVRFRIMRWCLRVKLAQHYEKFGELLMSTGHRPIVEESRKDDYWGAKSVGEENESLIGQNVLGRLLMELRELLREDSDRKLTSVLPLSIPDFYLMGKPIDAVIPEGPIEREWGTQRDFF
ncbi:NADAR family protein [Cupriavidus sp. D384]|uniref:NADAR family protein n=1 Tax=Cupriavidus sp. D384 TaxID=1538095 RepID=UPI001E326EB4|nr:NADAR family protein [Cupriavidus sp. D384]